MPEQALWPFNAAALQPFLTLCPLHFVFPLQNYAQRRHLLPQRGGSRPPPICPSKQREYASFHNSFFLSNSRVKSLHNGVFVLCTWAIDCATVEVCTQLVSSVLLLFYFSDFLEKSCKTLFCSCFLCFFSWKKA